MREAHLTRYFEVATNAFVVLAAITVLTTVWWKFAPREPKPQFHTGLERGRVFSPPPGVNFSQAEQTLLLALNPNCGDCEEEVSLIGRLVKARPENSRTRLIAISSSSEAAVKGHFLRNRINLDAISEVNFGQYMLPAPPAAILIDSEGKILDFWVGRLSDAHERQLLKALEGA